MTPLVSVVIVSYRSRDVLGDCLSSLESVRGEVSLEVIVVDNASGDGTAEAVRVAHPWVDVVDAGGNRGYGAAVNLGVARARGEAILVLNPDTVVPRGMLARLVAALEADGGAAAVAPALVDEHGGIARSCGRFPGLWTLACEHLGAAALFPGVPALCGSKLGRAALARAGEVDWASGAALLVRRDMFAAVGPFDENIFLYMEEVDWCRRAAHLGRRVRYVPAARFVHLGQRSARQVPLASYVHNLQSRIYYMRKHHGAPVATAARALLAASLVVKWLVARVVPARRAWAATYAAGFAAVAPAGRTWRRAGALATLAVAGVLAVSGGTTSRPLASSAQAATGSWASSPRAPGPGRHAYFYEYMPFAHVDSLADAGFDAAIVHSLADSTDARGATRLSGFRARGAARGVAVIPQWALQQPARLVALATARRYTWGDGRVEPDVACPLDVAWWRSAFFDRAEEVLAADPAARAVAVDLELYRGSLHHYDRGPCRCAACLAEYVGPAAGAVPVAELRGLHGWEEARVAEIVGALAESLAVRHPGVEIGIFDLDFDSFVHRGVARGLAAAGLPVADYCERSYSIGAPALADARARLDALGLARARLVGGIWLRRFAPEDAARAAAEVRACADGHFVFTTYSLWLDPRELTGPYTLAGAPGDYWRAFREAHAAP